MNSPLVTVSPSASVEEALRAMEGKGISRLVVEDTGRIVGIVTERDIVRWSGGIRGKEPQIERVRVDEVMTKNVITVDPNLAVKRAAEIILGRGVGSLPVVENLRGIGIVTKLDFAKVCMGFDDIYVGEVMQSEVRSVEPDERIGQCRRMMLDEDLAVLPVVKDGSLLGSLSLRKLAGLLLGMKEMERMRTMTAAEVMDSPPRTARTDWTLAEAAGVMLGERISGLPVVNPDGELVGILTKTELVEVTRERL